MRKTPLVILPLTLLSFFFCLSLSLFLSLHVAKFMRQRLPTPDSIFLLNSRPLYFHEATRLSRISRPGLCRTLQCVAREPPPWGFSQGNFHLPWKIITAQRFALRGLELGEIQRVTMRYSEKLCIFLTIYIYIYIRINRLAGCLKIIKIKF